MSTPGASSNMMQHAAQSSMMNHISPSDAMLMQEAAPSDAMMMQAAVPDNSMAMHPAPASSMMMHEAAPATPVAMFPAGADSMTMQAADSMAMQHADSMKMQPADSMSMMHVDEKASESMTMQQAAPADSMMAMHAAPAGSMMQHVEEKRASSGGMTRRKSVPPSMMTAETASMPPPFQSTAEVYDVSGISHPGVAKSALPAYWISDRPAGYYEKYPNPWSRVREFIREPMAELIATMLFVFVGLNANCQVLLTQNKAISDFPFGSFISIPFTWSLGAACAVWVAAGISGAHINPAGTIAAAIYRGFPWRKVPVYIFAQLLGGFFAGLLTYANWYHAIDIAEGGKGIRTVPGTAAIFTAYAPDFVPNANAFFDEFLMSFILIIVVFAFTDKHNAPPPPYIAPLAIFACVFALISGFAFNSGFTLDPARDFGPRLATAIFYGSEVWTFRHQYWLWCSWGAPVSGAIVAGAVYDGFLYIGPEALVNRRSAAARRWAAAEQYSRDRQMQGLPATA